VGQQNSSTLLGYTIPLENSTAQAVQDLVGTSDVVVAGPQYANPQSVGPHMTGPGYQWRNEKYSEAADAVDRGAGWTPLYAVSKSVAGGTNVTVTLAGGIGALTIDHALIAPHQSGALALWSGGLGFEAYDLTGLTVTAMSGNGVSPIAVTYGGQSLSAKGVVTGDTLCLSGDVEGNTAANVCTTVHVVDDTHLTLDGTTGNGTWTGFYSSEKDLILLPITGASITGFRTIGLTLGRAATTALKVGYADTPDVGGQTQSCQSGGPCGLIRDSDPFVGISGTGPSDAGATSSNPNYLLAVEAL
jgi:hypothetical protein